MKTKYLLLLLTLAAGLTAGCSYFTRWTHKSAPDPTVAGTLVEPTDRDAAWLAQAKAAYPLKTCIVSDEDLGGMGGALDRIYRQPGKPDRLLRFCCDGCPEDFAKDPARYLALLDHPAANPAPAAMPHH